MNPTHRQFSGTERVFPRQVALVDLLDRLLSDGVVLAGDVVLSIAEIDLVRVSLRALIVSVGQQHPGPIGETHGD